MIAAPEVAPDQPEPSDDRDQNEQRDKLLGEKDPTTEGGEGRYAEDDPPRCISLIGATSEQQREHDQIVDICGDVQADRRRQDQERQPCILCYLDNREALLFRIDPAA